MLNKLRYWLKSKQDIFRDFEKYVLDIDDNEKHRIFINKKSDVLFIAHLDTVLKPKFLRKTKKRIYTTGLDDRLGCLIAYELSKELNADLLLTDHEESFNSTAQYHDYKGYNWIVEFDRYRNDVVLYDCGSKDFENAINEYWKIGVGSFSDICMMNVNNCCMNIGIGYYNAHSQDSYCTIKQVKRQIEKFKLFYAKYKDVHFVRDVPCKDIYAYENDLICAVCNWNVGQKVFDLVVCEDCFNSIMAQYLYEEDQILFEEDRCLKG